MVALVLSMALAPAAVGAGGGDEVRVSIRATGAARGEMATQYGVRHDFGDVFTTNVPAAALAHLQARRDLAVSLVPQWQPIGKPDGGQNGKPGGGSGTRARPATQVPYGIQVVYDGSLGSARPTGGDNVKVAVIDTGIYRSHPDFAGKTFFRCIDFTPRNGTKNSCDDSNGHGTHVAGTIAASGGSDGLGIYGVAPAAPLGAYKVCGNAGCYADDIAAAIDLAVRDGAQIINMSLGGDLPDGLTGPAVQRAWAAGVLVVVAAGNDGGDGVGSIDYPGAYAESVAVASLYQVAAGTDYSAANLAVNSWSSIGSANSTDDLVNQEGEVELAAPGFSVESTGNDGAYKVMSGTSMATPHVAGLAARMWAEWGGSNVAVRSRLVDVARTHDITRRSDGTNLFTIPTGYDIHTGNGSARIRVQQ